jgi:hypothetical protein
MVCECEGEVAYQDRAHETLAALPSAGWETYMLDSNPA